MKPFKIDGILCVPTLIHYESKPAPTSDLFAENCTSLLEKLQVDLALGSEKGSLGSDEGRGARAIPRATGTWYSKSDTGFDGEEQPSEWKFCVQSHVHRDYKRLSRWFRANHKSIVLHCAGKMSSDPNETHAQATRTVNSISGRLSMGSTEESQHSSHACTSKQTSTVCTRRPRRPALRSHDSGGSHFSVNSTRTVRFEDDRRDDLTVISTSA